MRVWHCLAWFMAVDILVTVFAIPVWANSTQSMIDQFGNTETSTFDGNGNRVSTSWGSGNRVEGTYILPTPEHPEGLTLDAQGREIKYAYPILGTNQYADSMGHPISDLTGYIIPGTDNQRRDRGARGPHRPR